MKALVSLILAVALIGGVYVISTGGCKAQAQVAGDKLIKKINTWLGELDVKRKEIQNNVDELDSAIKRNHEAKVSAEVRLESFEDQIKPVKDKIDRIKKALAVLNPHLSATEEVDINGTMMAPAKIKEMANELLDQHESASSQLGALNATKKTYQQTHDLLSREYDTSRQQMASLKKKLGEIDIKKKALDDMKTAQTILGESGSISDKFTDLETEINELFLQVETGMRVESEKVSQREQTLDTSNETLDEILNDVESVDATQARIDAILGGGD